MEHQKTSLDTVKCYSWKIEYNKELVKGDTIVQLLSEDALAKEQECCPALQEDFKRHKHVVLYRQAERSVLVNWAGLQGKTKQEEVRKALKELAELVVGVTSKFKIEGISLQSELGEHTSSFLSALYVANHKVEYKTKTLRNIQKKDQAEFEKEQLKKHFEGTFCQLKRINILGDASHSEQEHLMAQSTILAKNMGSLRANMGSTTAMTRICTQIAEHFGDKVQVEVIQGQSLVDRGMNLIHAVGRANANPPALVDLFYQGAPEKDTVVSLVGKGITFDTGGLNIKVALMEQMYLDKCGACSVVSVFKHAVEMGLKVNLSCTVAWSENSISADAYRPSDIITSYKGLAVEIGNTDAEGRLCLADCMSYAQEKHKSSQLIEMSTLTGAMLIALGHSAAGVYSNDSELQQALVNSSHTRGEYLVALPLFQESYKDISTISADVNNTGKVRWGGAAQAAAFLHHFVEKDVKYAHIDIAGLGMDMANKCATGLGVQAVLQHIINQQ